MAEATIRDVARRAQVSVASVSRALNGLDNVSEEMRERVNEAARELGYVPHAGARSPGITLANAAGARAVAEHLLALGRRRIVHIAGPAGNIDAQERADAFVGALARRADVKVTTVAGDFLEESGQRAVKDLLARGI